MEFISPAKDINELKKLFSTPKNEYRPVPFYHLDGDISNDEDINSQLSGFKKSGYGGAALLPVSETLPKFGSPEYYTAYGKLLEKLRKNGMSAIYYDDLDFPSGWAGGEFAEKFPESLAKTLIMKESICTSGEHIDKKLETSGKLMSVCAYEVDIHEVLDLRAYCNFDENKITWDVPAGNWNLLQFVCVYEPGSKYVNYLSYEASQNFVGITYKRFTDKFSEYIGDVVGMTFYDDIQYRVKNRRMWDDEFNTEFENRFGFDPAPYYPALFLDIGNKTMHCKALMFNMRAKLLCGGFFKAVADFTAAHGLCCTGHVAESKTVQASWIFGDGMLYQKNTGAPGLDLVHSYGYGFNGLKLASSSAYNFDKELVVCEIYGNYGRLDKKILYKEAMNALVRGVNYLIPHTLWLSGKARIPHEVSHRNPEYCDILPALNEYISRAQTLLRGGRHICDIALLYPIYSLQSQTDLYESSAQGFEFPMPPSNADFMHVINTIMNYSCQDVTVIHPEVFEQRCYAEEGTLNLSNKVNFEQFKVLVLPSTSMISLASAKLIEKFYMGGGKIIATGELPSMAFEYTPDKNFDSEVCAIMKNVFGVNMAEVNTFSDYYENHNINGGEAYFILSEFTAADGTDTVDCDLFDRILSALPVSFDTIFENVPRVNDNGVLNLTLPAFSALNTETGIRLGGVFNCIHRKYCGVDIRFIANSTNSDYMGSVMLRGKLTVEEWNPYSGKARKITGHYEMKNNEIYTILDLDIPGGMSTFLVGRENI